MKRLQLLLSITFAFAFLFSSCKKKCDLPDDSNSGKIKNGVLIYPAGQLTSGEIGGRLITSSSPDAGTIQMSLNDGITKTAFDYGSYSILCYPTTTSCNSSFERTVNINDVNGTVTYKITITECGTCENKVYTENIVAVQAIPDTYQVFFDVKTK